jgi:hypothetical protein
MTARTKIRGVRRAEGRPGAARARWQIEIGN